jgi:hypothetical protein
VTDRARESLQFTLQQLERLGGSAFAASSTRVGVELRLSRYRSNESVVAGKVSYSGPTLVDGTPLRSVEGKLVPDPPGYDALKETGVRNELVWRGWKVDGARLQKEWLIRTDADRVALLQDVEEVLATIGPTESLELKYIAAGEDAGFAQVGCAVSFAAALLGALIGVVAVFAAAGSFNPGAGLIGLIVGLLTGVLASSQVLKLAVRVRRSRPNAENVAQLVGAGAAGILAAIVTVLLDVSL